PRDLIDAPPAALAECRQLAADRSRPPVIVVVVLEEHRREPPILAGRERCRAGRNDLDALRRLVALRAHPVRQARAELNAVAPTELLALGPAGRPHRELDRALQDERELVLVVVAVPLSARHDRGEQRLEVSTDEAL